MALEALLPSEIARLVYGYLIDERCMDAAKTFLNESPNLQECRSVMSYGRHFTTRVCGYALLDILEKFCVLNSIVQEQLMKSDNCNKLKNSGDLITQIKFFLEESKGEQLDTNSSTQSTSIPSTESPTKSRKRYSISSKNQDKRKQRLQIFDTQTQIDTDNAAVETTLLKNLPGYVDNLETDKRSIDKKKSKRSVATLVEDDAVNDKSLDKTRIISLQVQNIDTILSKQRCNGVNSNVVINNIETNFQKCINSEVQTSEDGWNISTLDKNIMTDTIEERSKKCLSSEVQTSDVESAVSEVLPSDECVGLLSDLTLELLNRTEIHERIANNINKILEPIKSNIHENPSKGTVEESNNSYISEFNKAVETAVDKTESDPEFLELLNSILLPNEEPVCAEDEMDVDIESVNVCEQEIAEVSSDKKFSDHNIDRESITTKKDDNKLEDVQVQIVHKAARIESTNNLINPTEIIQTDLINENSKLSKKEEPNNLESSTKDLLNSLESPILQQKSTNKTSNFYTHNNTITSTPLKPCIPVQNFDNCDWFSTQELPISNMAHHKDDTSGLLKANFPQSYTASQVIVTNSSFFSPIVSKDTSKIAEKLIIESYSSTHANKDQTLNTPEVAYSSSRIPSTAVSKNNKTPALQKNPEIIDDLLNLQALQKSTGNTDNTIPLLKESGEFNRFFSMDTVMLYGIDNNISALQTPVLVPEIEVEDSITFTGTGLSPFLKILKKPDEPVSTVKEDSNVDASIINNKLNELDTTSKKNDHEVLKSSSDENPSELDSVDKKNCETICIEINKSTVLDATAENSSEMTVDNVEVPMISDMIIKHTPKVLQENYLKNNPLSLSTPKKQSNYVRALDFDMTNNRSQSDSKAKGNSYNSQSPETLKRSLKSCKSSLFQSPPFTNIEIIEQKISDNPAPESDSGVTNSASVVENERDHAKEKMSVSHEKVAEHPSTSDKNKIDNKVEVKKESTSSKSWDSDLRKYLGESEVTKEEKKRNHKKREKDDSSKKNTPKKADLNSKGKAKKAKKEYKYTSKKAKKSDKKYTPRKSKKSEKSNNFSSKKKKKETNEANEAKILSQSMDSENVKRVKDPLEIILSDSINDDEAGEEDIMKLASDEMKNLQKLGTNEVIDIIKDKSEIVEQMHQDEESMIEALESISKDLTKKYFQEKDELKSNGQDDKATEKEKLTEIKTSVDYQKLEEQLSVITNTEVLQSTTSSAQVIYDQVSKVEQGKVVHKKYARIKTLDTSVTTSSRLNEFILDFDSPKKDVGSLQVPPTPQIHSPSSSSLMMPSWKLNEDSRTIQSLIPTPIECPLTPNIVFTPPKTINETTHNAIEKNTTSYYHPKLITFEPKPTKKSVITQFEVIKENLHKDDKMEPSYNTKNIDEDEQKLQSLQNLKSQVDSKIVEEDVQKLETQSDIKEVDEIMPASNNQPCTKIVDDSLKLGTSMSYRDKLNSPESEDSDLSSTSSYTCDTCSHSSSSDEEDNNIKDLAPEDKQNEINEAEKKGETSPTKVFPFNKTDKELTDSMKETPNKDENQCIEEGISDTPNISKLNENPTNLNAKISQMLILKEQEEAKKLMTKSKPKIINIERVTPQMNARPPTSLMKALPLNIQLQALEMKNESSRAALIQRIKSDKCQNEVEKAVESITKEEQEKLNKSLELFNKSSESIVPSPFVNDDDDSIKKVELVKAIESITKTDYEEQQHGPHEDVVVHNENSSETNLQLVLEDEEEAPSNSKEVSLDQGGHMHNTRYKSRQRMVNEKNESLNKSSGLSNSAPCHEIHFTFDEDNYKKKRRKCFTEKELTFQCYDEDANELEILTATPLHILFNLQPPRKKRVKKVPISKKDEIVNPDEDDSRDFIAINNNIGDQGVSKISNKRKKVSEENETAPNTKKRRKNTFIL